MIVWCSMTIDDLQLFHMDLAEHSIAEAPKTGLKHPKKFRDASRTHPVPSRSKSSNKMDAFRNASRLAVSCSRNVRVLVVPLQNKRDAS